MDVQTRIADIYQRDSRRILATLIRLLGDFDLAEEALQDAFIAATEQWPKSGFPDNPRAWLVSAGRFKGIDQLRRRQRQIPIDADSDIEAATPDLDEELEDYFRDDHLRLIFTCCHPALSPEAQTALTLRTICDLSTEEIASAFLSSAPTIAQRIVRAKSKIRDANIPYELPSPENLHERLDSVLQVIYLVFNEGYSATSGDTLTRRDLSGEAIRLGRLLVQLLPDAETRGLLALMLLHESRRPARCNDQGELVILEQQDRKLWDRTLSEEGRHWLDQALSAPSVGRYALQAAIAAVHARANRSEETDWAEIVSLYDLLLRANPSPVVALNRAIALAMRDGPEAGLHELYSLNEPELHNYQPLYAARADLEKRCGRLEAAKGNYQRALALTRQAAQRLYLEKQLAEVSGK